jgi:hypothetical protein
MINYTSTAKQSNTIKTEEDDNGIEKYYAVNHDSTCIFVTTVKDETKISQAVLETFERASVLFLAISTAISKSGKKLFDFDTYNKALGGSGYFTGMQLQKKTFEHTAFSLSIQLDVIAKIIGTAVAPEAALALTDVIGAIGSEINIGTSTDKSVTKVAKAMLWVEEIMGVPDVSIQLWYVNRADSATILNTPCVNVTTTKVTFDYNMQEFTFVDPAWINQFTPDFKDNPDFDALVDKLSKLITT